MDASDPPIEFPAALGPTTPLNIHGVGITLGELTEELIKYDSLNLKKFFHERGQCEIGMYLFEQLFGHLTESEREQLSDRNAQVDLRIVSDDEQISSLPWTLLNDRGRFVAASGWSISLSPSPEKWRPVELPPSPRMIIVMPEPEGWPDTRAETHLRDLEKSLSSINSLHTCDKNLCVVKSWEDLRQKIQEIQPDILYYYGHGNTEVGTSHLIFAQRIGNLPIQVSATEFANLLCNLGTNAPVLVYINCCLGDAGGLLGIGRQVRQVIPVVITNFSKVYVDKAQNQALDIWRSILINGLPPHEAVAIMRKRFGGEAGALSEVSWMTPVVHRSYDRWNFNPHLIPDEFDLIWRHTLDRIKHTGEVFYLMGTMMREHRQQALTFLWYGKKGQGVEQFYKRVEVELHNNRLPNTRVYKVRPDWPPQFDNFQQSVRDMLKQAFEVDDYRMVAEQIRVKANKMGGYQTIIYLHHPPITKGMELYKTDQLKSYLQWLDAEFVSRLSEHVFALIGLAFIVEEPDNFRRKVERNVEGVKYHNMSFRVLDELGKIRSRDLDDYFWWHNISIPDDKLQIIKQLIMDRTHGEYESVLNELIFLREVGPWDYIKTFQPRHDSLEDGDY